MVRSVRKVVLHSIVMKGRYQRRAISSKILFSNLFRKVKFCIFVCVCVFLIIILLQEIYISQRNVPGSRVNMNIFFASIFEINVDKPNFLSFRKNKHLFKSRPRWISLRIIERREEKGGSCGTGSRQGDNKEEKGLPESPVYLETSMQVFLGTGVIWQTSPRIVKLFFPRAGSYAAPSR